MLKNFKGLVLGLALVVVASSCLWSQALFATLTGIVSDPSGAVIGGANVTLRNAESGDERTTITDSQGYYTFASVPVGTYNVVVASTGFEGFKVNGVQLGGGESKNVNASMQVGSTNQVVEVSGTADIITPSDSGEKSFALTTDQLQNYVQTGSNAAEYLKIMPGFGNTNGANNKASYTGQIVGINGNGDGGSQSPLNGAYSYNGLPGNTLDIVSDGAHVSDPGCNCATPVNPNSDFLQEFRVETSNFGADEQKGPMVITSITKSGGAKIHGEGFFTARNYTLNSNDAYANATGLPRPQNKFYYPGGQISGPVVLPFTRFNHNHDKLFFFAGFEYFFQTIDTGVLTATVPTAEERTGNFCNAAGGEGILYNGKAAVVPNFGAAGCVMPTSSIDPNMQKLMNLYPLPNTQGQGFNYATSVIFNQPNWQSTNRVDYNVSDNTKIFVRYNAQREQQPFPVGLWWRQADQVPYPTSVVGKNRSDALTGTVTHVFSPTMTNETVFAYTYISFPNVFSNPAKVNPSNVGFNEKLLLQNKSTGFQIPSFGGNGGSGEAALIFNPGGFEAGGSSAGLYADKWLPSASDTVTKVVERHTLKIGGFYEWIRNTQPANNNTNGYMQFVPTANTQFTTGNAYADMLQGNLSSFGQGNFNRLNDITYSTYEAFVQDSWKVNTRLTIDAGVRLTHFTPWADALGYGYSVFNPAAYKGSGCTGAPSFCGFTWGGRDAAVPLGGFPTRDIFWQPRAGLAYDLFGKGSTVLRGGWGRFYYHTGQFTSGLDTSAGSSSVTITPNSIGNHPLLVSNLGALGFNGQPSAPGAVDQNDNRQPYTDSYSFTISQKTPWRGLLEVGYVGNSSRDLQSGSGYGSNQNLVARGALFNADPVTGAAQTNAATANANDYRPYVGYGDINLATNNLYSNYNAAQISFAHQGSLATLQLNYTYGKSLGIISSGGSLLGNGGATYDPFNLNNNYGPLASDRRHIFNAAYSVNLGNRVHGNKIVAGVVNGWQLSGTTQLQSGANLTGVAGQNFGLSLVGNNVAGNCIMDFNAAKGCIQGAIIPGTVSAGNPEGIAIGNQSILGTNAIQLNPILTCNPTKGFSGSHTYLNAGCFSAPNAVGENGATTLPEIVGPAYFNSDLGLFKNFQVRESMKLQFRVQASNFLNHPLWTLGNGNPLNLTFSQDASGKLNLANPNFGTAQYKVGQRIVEFAVKFYF